MIFWTRYLQCSSTCKRYNFISFIVPWSNYKCEITITIIATTMRVEVIDEIDRQLFFCSSSVMLMLWLLFLHPMGWCKRLNSEDWAALTFHSDITEHWTKSSNHNDINENFMQIFTNYVNRLGIIEFLHLNLSWS